MLPGAGSNRPRTRRRPTTARWVLACAWVLFALLLGISSLSSGSPGEVAHDGVSLRISADNSSSGTYGLCPSSGPTFLGVDWNCIAVLNLTVVSVMLGAVGIVAYVFRDSDAAELPSDSAEVPLTEEEWAEFRRRRRELIAEGRRSDATERDRPG